MAQSKRYALDRELTIAAGGTNLIEILNNQDRRANWHGIRFWCKIRADNVSADNEAHGIVALYVKPASNFPGLSEGSFDSDSDLQNLSEILLAVCPWAVFGGSSNPIGANTFQEIECVFKSSRSVGRGASLVAHFVNYTESAKSVVVQNALLSCFETTI